MWISRETWRKVLPWSRAHSFRIVFTAALAAAALAGIAGGTPLAAQEQPTEAVLLSGPTPVKGIPVYAPNRIPAFRGVYTLEGAEKETPEASAAGARILTVLYTRQDLLIPQSWTFRSCSAWKLFQIPDYETFTLCYRDDRGFFLFFFFPEIQEPAYWCGFADPFIERFLFLSNFVKSETDVPFPAILQVE
jgi:hypothetical protein